MPSSEIQHVLLICDRPNFTRLIHRMLKFEGIQLDTVPTINEAGQYLLMKPYNALLIDMKTIALQIETAVEEIERKFGSLPVILLLSSGSLRTKAQALLESGAAYLLEGTFTSGNLKERRYLVDSIQTAVALHAKKQLEEQALVTPDRLKTSAPGSDILDRQAHQQARLNQIISRVIARYEDDRHRTAIYLYDDIGQFLTAIRLSLALCESEAAARSNDCAQQILTSIHLIEASMDELRKLSQQLRPPSLDALGLNQALYDFCQAATSRIGTAVVYIGTNADTIPDFLQIILYQLTQILLDGIPQLEIYEKVSVRLKHDAETVTLVIAVDPGANEAGPQIFLPVMSRQGNQDLFDQIEVLGGKIDLETSVERQLIFRASIPLPRDL